MSALMRQYVRLISRRDDGHVGLYVLIGTILVALIGWLVHAAHFVH
jgi:hypothetical protein